ncbi:MAG: mercury methylation corrinoid protein HgcA [Smithella sp.]
MDKFQFPIIQEQSNCGCSAATIEPENTIPDLNQSFVSGFVDTPTGRLPQISSVLYFPDRWGSIKARWGVGRMDYKVDPGLYALGTPDNNSLVFVSANYKMSFDRLRSALVGRTAWILALDTKGINVWCAAGKGTFGTDELVKRIKLSGLKNIVSHRKLILPQLGAPGIAAHRVKQISGFNVQYGPIRAEDLPAYLDAGFKATEQMRIKTFPLKERAVLIPIELIEAMKTFLILAALFFIIRGIGGPAGFWANAGSLGYFAVLALLCAVIGGAVLNPLLLPYLPGRAFSIKGFSIGIVIAVILLYLRDINLTAWPGRIEAMAWLFIIPAVSGFLAMNFTGCSTYTSLSGVKREMRWALPLEIACGATGIILWLDAIFIY